ncbi:MAG: putative toxin-antitoxin system toxin component, PIN family [Clostridiales bacterium]|jgi:putative PIN family toxin of toxin-antitoxin system|nr:putative toxin-antitoxin system toxin component, PIN family [Clostridiales bacterium]
MKIVLDTNVLVSGLLKSHSDAGAIVRMVASGSLQVVYDSRILSEYRDVLRRPKFSFEDMEVEAVLTQIKAEGILADVKPLKMKLPDKDDEPFLEAALSMAEAILVTGNKKHFPLPANSWVLLLNPGEFISYWRERTGDD